MFTKAHSDNIYSIKNILKDGYKVVHEYKSERGPMTAFIKWYEKELIGKKEKRYEKFQQNRIILVYKF